jgi:hypothetical protein
MIVVVHNSQTKESQHILRVKLPGANYKAELWNKTKKAFTGVVSDIFEQVHFQADSGNFTDYEMFV